MSKFKIGDMVRRRSGFNTWGLGGGPMRVTLLPDTAGALGEELIALDNGHAYWHACKFELADTDPKPQRAPSKHAAEFTAYHQGYDIQFQIGAGWFDSNYPDFFDDELTWRIKPQGETE